MTFVARRVVRAMFALGILLLLVASPAVAFGAQSPAAVGPGVQLNGQALGIQGLEGADAAGGNGGGSASGHDPNRPAGTGDAFHGQDAVDHSPADAAHGSDALDNGGPHDPADPGEGNGNGNGGGGNGNGGPRGAQPGGGAPAPGTPPVTEPAPPAPTAPQPDPTAPQPGTGVPTTPVTEPAAPQPDTEPPAGATTGEAPVEQPDGDAVSLDIAAQPAPSVRSATAGESAVQVTVSRPWPEAPVHAAGAAPAAASRWSVRLPGDGVPVLTAPRSAEWAPDAAAAPGLVAFAVLAEVAGALACLPFIRRVLGTPSVPLRLTARGAWSRSADPNR